MNTQALTLSEPARLALLDQKRNSNLVKDLVGRITQSGKAAEVALASLFGEMEALGEVLRIEKAARAGTFQQFCKEALTGIDERELRRYMDLATAVHNHNQGVAEKMQAMLADGRFNEAVILEIGETIRSASEADNKSGAFKWAAELARPKPAPRERPVKRLTTEERLEQRKGEVRRNWQHLETAHKGYGIQFTLKDDLEVQAETALLDAQSAVRKAWLKTPAKKRDPRALEKMLDRLLNATAKD